MRVAIDMRTYQLGGWKRGIGEYTRNLVCGLLRHDVEVVLLGENKLAPIQPIPGLLAGSEYISDGKQYDVFHCVDPMSVYEGIDASCRLPVRAKVKTSVFFDAIPLLYENNGLKDAPSVIQAAYHARLFGMLEFDKVFAISDEAKHQYYQVLQRDCEAINIGIESIYPETEPDNEKIKIDRPYILTIGGDDPHKGWDILEEAYAIAKVSNPNLRWVIIGDQKRKRTTPGIAYLGYVSAATRRRLIEGAQAVCVPSYIEGLGLPAYEAALLGKTAIIRDIGAFRDLPAHRANSVDDWVLATKFPYLGNSLTPFGKHDLRQKYNWEKCCKQYVEQWEGLL